MDEYFLDYDGSQFNFRRNLKGSTADGSLVMVNVTCSLQDYEAVLCKLMDADYELKLGLFNPQVQQLQPPPELASASAMPLPMDDHRQFLRDLEIFNKMTCEQPSASQKPCPPEPPLPTAPHPTAPRQSIEACRDDSMSELMTLLQDSASKLGYEYSGEHSYSNSSHTFAIKFNGEVKSRATDSNLIEAQRKAVFAALYKANPEAALAWDAKYMK
jgi:hypothetical protein